MDTRTEPTRSENACFEAGIKFGSLYHQFAGTPVSPQSSASLERAMESAIENQPYCRSVEVDIDDAAIREELREESHDYTELTGRFLDVSIVVSYEGCEVVAELAMVDGYPLMSVASIREE